jgi:methionyl-tRNA formyltransferase
MRLAFAGTPAFARAALAGLLEAGFQVVQVLSQPDRPAGRGLQSRPSEVKALALEQGLPVFQPPTLRADEALAALAEAGADAMIVAAYGLLLPSRVLELFPIGCINIHASLLPRWRGAAPIARAILEGDEETGISIMRMDTGLDTGPVYLRRALPIAPHDTARTLHDRLAALGARCIVEALPMIEHGLMPQPQSVAGVTYAHKIGKGEAELDWGRSATALDRQVRAFNPFPVASTTLRGESLRVWKACALDAETGPPGVIARVERGGLVVGCGSGALRIEEVQRPGARRMPVSAFVAGVPVREGERLGR